MGREVKRVHRDFDWPIGETWAGYLMDEVPCPVCKRLARSKHADCKVCYGDDITAPRIEPPKGYGATDYWQMWETCSEGSPISPPMPTQEALARWLADNKASAFGHITATYEEWLAMIVGHGWAPSALISEKGLQSGVAGMAEAPQKPASAP